MTTTTPLPGMFRRKLAEINFLRATNKAKLEVSVFTRYEDMKCNDIECTNVIHVIVIRF